jgi:hypothetical protein
MQVNTYIAIENIAIDEFIKRKFFINYLNIGKPSELKLDNIPLGTMKLWNPDTDSYGYESSIKHCITYYADEVEIIKKYHPEAIILPFINRLDKLKKILEDDLDVPVRRFSWNIQ